MRAIKWALVFVIVATMVFLAVGLGAWLTLFGSLVLRRGVWVLLVLAGGVAGETRMAAGAAIKDLVDGGGDCRLGGRSMMIRRVRIGETKTDGTGVPSYKREFPGREEGSMNAEALRVYPPQAEPGESGGMGLSEAYEELMKPHLRRKNRRLATYREYETCLRRWEAFSKDRSHRPILQTLSAGVLEDFQDWLLDTLKGKNVENTVNKHVKAVLAIMRRAKRRGELQNVPDVEMLDANRVAGKRYLEYEEVDALYRACEIAKWPPPTHRTQCNASRLWRAAIVVYFNYGLRTQELMAYEGDHDGVRWSSVFWEDRTPDPDGHARNEHGWIRYTPQKQRWAKNEPVTLPLNEITRKHLEGIRPQAPGEDDRVFEVPLCSNSFYDQWRAICEKAGRDTGNESLRSLEVKGLRKTASTWHNKTTPGIAPFVLGHAERGVNAMHYTNVEQQLVEHFAKFPQPESFTEEITNGRDEQLWLFA